MVGSSCKKNCFQKQLWTNTPCLRVWLQVLDHSSGAGGGGLGVNLDICVGKEDPTTFFNDGVRKIDFVLVFEETLKADGAGDDYDLTTPATDLDQDAKWVQFGSFTHKTGHCVLSLEFSSYF